MNKQLVLVLLVPFFTIGFLCGCTENSDTTDGINLSVFLGTWEGNMETSLFGFRGNDTMWNRTDLNGTMGNMTEWRNGTWGNMTDFRNTTLVNITELEFTVDTLYMTITTANGTQTMSQSYTVEGDQLVLSFQFTGERSEWGQPPPDGERPPFDGENPFNGEPPFGGERPSRTRSYTYSFNEDQNILYLDGNEFRKNF